MRKKWMFYIGLGIMILMLIGCSTDSNVDTSEVTAAEALTNTTETLTQDVTAIITEGEPTVSSGWMHEIIDGGVEITEVFKFAEGLIGISSKAVYYSSNGLDWEMTLDLSPYSFYEAFEAGSQFVVYDSNNAHFTSDGKGWSSSERHVYHLFNSAMYDGSKYVSVDTGYLGFSDDGLKYNRVRTDENNPLSEVYFLDPSGYAASIYKMEMFDGKYYAIGAGIWSSSDGYVWDPIIDLSEITYAATDMLYNGSEFVINASYNAFHYDGSTLQPINPDGRLFLVDDQGRFIATSHIGTASISEDGLIWNPLFEADTITFMTYCAVIFDEHLYVYGEDGNIRYRKIEE